VRSRQDTDRSVLKMVSWNQLAVEYVPEQVVTPPVPEM
jgi:hypothetical protein